MWTNESLNIWTHLIGGLWFLFVIFYDNLESVPSMDGKLEDHVIVTTFDFCFAVSMSHVLDL